jgi:hypothetical protein
MSATLPYPSVSAWCAMTMPAPFRVQVESTGPASGVATLFLDAGERPVVVLDLPLVQRLEATLRTLPTGLLGLVVASATPRALCRWRGPEVHHGDGRRPTRQVSRLHIARLRHARPAPLPHRRRHQRRRARWRSRTGHALRRVDRRTAPGGRGWLAGQAIPRRASRGGAEDLSGLGRHEPAPGAHRPLDGDPADGVGRDVPWPTRSARPPPRCWRPPARGSDGAPLDTGSVATVSTEGSRSEG